MEKEPRRVSAMEQMASIRQKAQKGRTNQYKSSVAVETREVNGKIEESIPIENRVCFVNKIEARSNHFEVCDHHYSIQCHFRGKPASEQLCKKIGQQDRDINIVGLIGK
jgi:hypothetical protein